VQEILNLFAKRFYAIGGIEPFSGMIFNEINELLIGV
jgi:hypothetical protein